MYDVALGKRKLAPRVLRFDGSSGACDVRVRGSRYSHIQKESFRLIALARSKIQIRRLVLRNRAFTISLSLAANELTALAKRTGAGGVDARAVAAKN